MIEEVSEKTKRTYTLDYLQSICIWHGSDPPGLVQTHTSTKEEVILFVMLRTSTEVPPVAGKFATPIARRYHVLHSIFAWFHLLTFLGGVGMIISENIVALSTVYLIRKERAVQEPIVSEMGSIRAEWVIACAPLVSSLGHFVVTASNAPHVLAGRIRYVDYAISSTCMIFTVALLCGMADLLQLFLLCISQAVLCLLGAVVSLAESSSAKWSVFVFSSLLHLAVWAALALVLYLNIRGEVLWVYALTGTLFAFFSSFAVVELAHLNGWITATGADNAFLVLSAVAKNFLQWTLLRGVASMEETDADSQNLRVYGTVMGALTVVSIILAILIYRINKLYSPRTPQKKT